MRKLVILGRTVLGDFADEDGKVYLEWLSRQDRLALLKQKQSSPDFISLEAILSDVSRASTNTGNRKVAISAEEVISYGRFLLSALASTPITQDVLTRARRIGIGPGVYVIEDRVGSLGDFYRESGVPKKNPEGIFDHWTRDMFIDYIKDIASLNKGYVSVRMLDNHSKTAKQQGIMLPGFKAILRRDWKLSDLVKEAGVMHAPNHPWTREGYVQSGIEFAKNHEGIQPKRGNLSKDGLPSSATVHKYFGGIANYREIIAQRLED